jgi:hypothetical protein
MTKETRYDINKFVIPHVRHSERSVGTPDCDTNPFIGVGLLFSE